MDGVASPSQGVSVQAVGRLVGQRVVVVGRRQRRTQRGLTVVVGSPCGTKQAERVGAGFRSGVAGNPSFFFFIAANTSANSFPLCVSKTNEKNPSC